MPDSLLPLQSRSYPACRPRRLRVAPWCRRLVAETHLAVDDLILPIFIHAGSHDEEPIPSLPGVNRYSVAAAANRAAVARAANIRLVALFPSTPPALRDNQGSEASNPDNLVCRTSREIKRHVADLGVMCDVALDPYTQHGHDGLLQNGIIANDATLSRLVEQSLIQVEAGCDILAPSDMMDGRVGVIRAALEKAGHHDIAIMAYAAKYASAFYGPFRDAVGSGDQLQGEKNSYQMDPANSNEALREVSLDLAEGADMILIKPGLPYLDIIRRIRDHYPVPLFGYQVSGEYAMIVAAAERGWIDRKAAIIETLTGFRRAGCDGIVTYFALEAAQLLSEVEG